MGNGSDDAGPLNAFTINPGILGADYAIRGKLPALAATIRTDLARGSHKWPFGRVVSLNLGNPQGCGQKPLTFFRQVLALLEYPKLLELSESSELAGIFPKDAIDRAHSLLRYTGSVGAYSSNFGYQCVRESVAAYISRRDGFPSSPDEIFLTCGAFEGMLVAMTLLSGSHMRPGNEKVGVLLPVPFYPVYRALLITLDLVPIPYRLDEQDNWKVPSRSTMTAIVAGARAKGVTPRCIVMINPSNPTGRVSEQTDIETLVELAAKENLMLLADEVYQENLFVGHKFVSCKSVVRQLQAKRSANDACYQKLQLISLHSVSKGVLGEGGQRDGYLEATGFSPEIHGQIAKFITYMLQPASAGQILVELMVHPPEPGQESYESHKTECDAVRARLQRNADALDHAFAQMPNVDCAPSQGAIYHFPCIKLPQSAVRAAKDVGEAPDVWYCKAMLESTGVCVVPGSGFGMEDGTADGRIWYRITFLDDKQDWVDAVRVFQERFVHQYQDKI